MNSKGFALEAIFGGKGLLPSSVRKEKTASHHEYKREEAPLQSRFPRHHKCFACDAATDATAQAVSTTDFKAKENSINKRGEE